MKGGARETPSDGRQVRKLIWSAEGKENRWNFRNNPKGRRSGQSHYTGDGGSSGRRREKVTNKKKTFFNCFPIRCENEENTRRRMCTRIADPQVTGHGTSPEDNRRHAAVAKQRERTPLEKLIKQSSVSSVSGVASAHSKTRKTSLHPALLRLSSRRGCVRNWLSR